MIQMYEFYAQMSKKRPLCAWKDIYKFEREPTDLKEYGGKLLDDICVVDVDDGHESDIIKRIIEQENINCVIRKTSRGRHFYFKNRKYKRNKSNQPCAIGVNIEIKLGCRENLNPIKVNGEVREIERECETMDFIPFWLTPMGKSYPHMTGMDGNRNDCLRNIQLALPKRGIDYEEFLVIAGMINNHVFKEPLYSRYGFNEHGVLRRELYPDVEPDFFVDGKFQHVTFGEHIKVRFNIYNINNKLHIYRDGVYMPDEKEIEKSMLKVIPSLKTNQRKEVMNYLRIMADDREIESADFIAFKNIILNIKKKEFLEHNPNLIFLNKLAVDYADIPEVKTPDHKAIDTVLTNLSCGDDEIKTLLLEMIGYCMYRRNELGRVFLLVGSGSNGKSTLLNLISDILGPGNVSSLDIKEFQEKFKREMLYGKLANIGDDISAQYIQDSSEFKKLATGDPITAEKKGQDAFSFKNYATMIFSANKLPKTSDKSDGFYRRFLPIPLDAKFKKSDKKFDFEIIDKLKTMSAKEYLANIAIHEFDKVLKRKAFTIPQKVTKLIENYKKANSNVLLFLDDYPENLEESTLSEVFLSYQLWCKDSGHKHCAKAEFKSELYEFGYEVNSKSSRNSKGKVGKFLTKKKSEQLKIE